VDALTPAERRGAMVVVVLLALGAFQDLWRATRPLPAAPTGRATIAEPHVPHAFDAGVAPPPANEPVVDLNRATASELETLPGVGPVLAGRIIAHRERHGAFRHPDELLAVRGIGPRLLARLQARVTAGSDRAGSAHRGPGRLQTAAPPMPLRADSGSVRSPPVPITRQD
jgi:competence ComEA-like helix-hairpin-helix protein